MKKETTSVRLKKIMEDRKLRQIDILNLTKPFCNEYSVKMNKADISQYVSGKNEPNQEKLFVLSKALNVSEAWLMGYDVPSKPVKELNKNIFISNLNLMMIIQMEHLGEYKYDSLHIDKERLNQLQLGKVEPTVEEIKSLAKAFNIDEEILLATDLTSAEGKPLLDKWLEDLKSWDLMDIDFALEDEGIIEAKKSAIYQIMRHIGVLNIDCMKDIYNYVVNKSIEPENLDKNSVFFQYIIYKDEDMIPVNKSEYLAINNEIKKIKEESKKLLEDSENIKKVLKTIVNNK